MTALALRIAIFVPALMAGTAALAETSPEVLLPSGAKAIWQETRHDSEGGAGLTYRFRFVVADLALRTAMASQSQAGDDDDARGPIDIDTDSGDVTGDDAEPALIDPADLPENTVEGDETAEQEADAMLGAAASADDPAQDATHADIVWLCENYALPRTAKAPVRPQQIVVSLSDRALPFGAYDPDAVQLFEAFTLPADRDACLWEPW